MQEKAMILKNAILSSLGQINQRYIQSLSGKSVKVRRDQIWKNIELNWNTNSITGWISEALGFLWYVASILSARGNFIDEYTKTVSFKNGSIEDVLKINLYN